MKTFASVLLLGLALLSGAASAEQLEGPHGGLFDVDDAHLQSALENGYKRVSAERTSDLATRKGPDEPSEFDWRLVGVGVVFAVIGSGALYAFRTRKQ